MDKEDIELINQVKKGDSIAFEKLLGKHYGLVLKACNDNKWVMTLCDKSLDYDEFIHMGSISFYKAAMSYEEKFAAKFSTYFYIVAKNDFLTYAREFKSKRIFTVSLDEEIYSNDSNDIVNKYTFYEDERSRREFQLSEDIMCVNSFLKYSMCILKPKEFEVFTRVVFNGESLEEIAKECGVTRQNTSKVYMSAKSKLKGVIQKKGFNRFF